MTARADADDAARLDALRQAFSQLTSDAWALSPHRATLSSLLAAETLATLFVQHYPESRDDVLARLSQVLVNVTNATAPVRDRATH